MRNLPIQVSEDDIEEMFTAVDKNKDAKISYREFQKMINPPDIPQPARPHVSHIGLKSQVFFPPSGKAFFLASTRESVSSYLVSFKLPLCPGPCSSSEVAGPSLSTPGSVQSSFIETLTNMSKD